MLADASTIPLVSSQLMVASWMSVSAIPGAVLQFSVIVAPTSLDTELVMLSVRSVYVIIYRVKPVYSGHLSGPKLAAIQRWSDHAVQLATSLCMHACMHGTQLLRKVT